MMRNGSMNVSVRSLLHGQKKNVFTFPRGHTTQRKKLMEKKNFYEMSMDHYFSSPVHFTVEAVDKKSAMKAAMDHPVITTDSGNLRMDSLHVVKKIKPGKKKQGGKRIG